MRVDAGGWGMDAGMMRVDGVGGWDVVGLYILDFVQPHLVAPMKLISI